MSLIVNPVSSSLESKNYFEILADEMVVHIIQDCADVGSTTGLQTYNNLRQTSRRFKELTNCVGMRFVFGQPLLGENEFNALRLSRWNVIQIESRNLLEITEDSLQNFLVCLKYNRVRSSSKGETALFDTVRELLHSSLVKSYSKKLLLQYFKKVFDDIDSYTDTYTAISRHIDILDPSLSSEIQLLRTRIESRVKILFITPCPTREYSYDDEMLDAPGSPFARELRAVDYVKKSREVTSDPNNKKKMDDWRNLALNALAGVLQENSQSVFALETRADIFNSLKMPNEVLDDYNALLQLDPMNTDVRQLRLKAFLEQGNLEAALEDNRVLMTIDPSVCKTLERADIYRRLGRHENALEDLATIIARNDSPLVRSKARRIRGDIYMDQNRFDKAMQEYREIVVAHELGPALNTLLMWRKVEEAVDLVKGRFLFNPVSPRLDTLYKYLSLIFESSGSILALEAQYEMHKRSRFLGYFARNDLASFLERYRKKDPARALEILQEVFASNLVNLQLAESCLIKASTFYREFVATQKQHTIIDDNEVQTRYQEALEEFDEFLKLQWPEYVRIHVEKMRDATISSRTSQTPAPS